MKSAVVAGAAALGAASAAGAGYLLTMSTSSQILGTFPYRADGVGLQVALTFDDGPNEPFTRRIARTLTAAGVRGTFFQVGQAVRRDPDTTQALLAEGHVIGNHSHSHRYHRGFGRDAIAAEIDQAQEAFDDCAGIVPALYRPPWLTRTPALFRLLREREMTAVSGTFCHALEVAQIRGARIAKVAERRTDPGSIVIFHDGYNGVGASRHSTVVAVEMLLDHLLQAGYEPVTVDQLLGVPAYL